MKIPLTQFMSLFSYYTPWKHPKTYSNWNYQKTKGLLMTSEGIGFLMFSGGTKRDQWHEMG